MTITTSLEPGAIASATSVSVKQKNEQNTANLRPEIIVAIGQAQTGKTVTENKLFYASGNADDIGVTCGFGSPLHRMAKKLFPKAGNGSKVDTYFIVLEAPSTAKEEIKTLTVKVQESIKKSFNGYFILNDLIFEAAADVAAKVATNAHNNPAKAPRGIVLNSFEKTYIPFNLTKGMTAKEAAEALKEALEDYIELPFETALGETDGSLVLTAKWKGSDSFFEFNITNEDEENIDASIYGVSFETARTQESSGIGSVTDETLALLNKELGVTRVISQYATTTVLDKLQEHFDAFHDGLIAQYVICYSAIQAPESETNKGTWDITKLVEEGNKRKDDFVNVQLVGDFKNLRKLEYREINKLVKAGYSYLLQKADGSYKIMDLVSFYHPDNKTNPLFRYDRDITAIGNITYHFMKMKEDEEWESIILVGKNDLTTNPYARTLDDIKAKINSGISYLGQAGLIANYAEAQKNTKLEIDSINPNRININPDFDLTGVGRIYDLTNFIGFNTKG